jgi:hypothetical protein
VAIGLRLWERPAAALAAALLALALVAGPVRRAAALLQDAYTEARTFLAYGADRRLTSPHFVLLYPPGEGAQARLVLATAERDYPEVTRDLGYTPAGRALLVLDPTEAAMRLAFGWSPAEDALGAYYAGTVHILAPDQWLWGLRGRALARAFAEEGPVAHELTHLVLDEETAGNFPAWYTEGLAQYEERRLTGYEWVEPDNNLLTRPLYGPRELAGSFYSLPDQALAYREALSLVTYLARRYGGLAALRRLDAHLAWGEPFALALYDVTGRSFGELYRGWRAWVRAHPRPWES